VDYQELVGFLQYVGQDPSRLVFEDELTGLQNRRYLHGYLERKVAWTDDRDFPLALLIFDLDRFKSVNDSHGQAAGDQALVWFAGLLKEAAGADGIPVRYAGDEFGLLLPKTRPLEARQVAEGLLSQTSERPFRLRDSGTVVPITVSIGIATAPDDAPGPSEFIRKADTALYHAKASGRNQTANAREADPTKVFGNTALHQLRAVDLVGREEVLTVVQEALADLTAGQSQFLLVEGAPGLGKTAVLETVRGTHADDPGLQLVRARGDLQEANRPFYLVSQILMGLFDLLEDHGLAILQELDATQIAYLGELLPQAGPQQGASSKGARLRREGIFNVLLRLIENLAESRPIVLLIDDIHAADHATLHLIRVLLRRREARLFVCATATEPPGEADEGSPLDCFEEQEIRRVKLQHLTGNDISEHLHGTFPGLTLPPGLEEDLAQLTQGNPLFLNEIVRKLVMEDKVTLSEAGWAILRLEDDYLPRSLDKIVQQKITALERDGQRILAHASIFGDNLSLSFLAGSSDVDEGRILDFLDHAEALGLMRLDYQLNDETLRFLGKRIFEITYGGISPERRSRLHERVGVYLERLFQQRLFPSASLLAYHFERAANSEKATQYEQLRRAYDQRVFDPAEAALYTGEPSEAETGAEEHLSAEGRRRVPHVLRMLLSAIRSTRLYPPDSQPIARAQRKLAEALEQVHEHDESLSLSQSGDALLANGQKLDVGEYKALAGSFLELLARAELQGMAFRQGMNERELAALLVALGRPRSQEIGEGFWQGLLKEHGAEHIELQQMRADEARRAKAAGSRRIAEEQAAEDQPLAAADLPEVPKVLLALAGAIRNVRLYPLESQPVAQSIELLHGALQEVLSRQPVLTLAGVHGSLLVNGARVFTAEFETLANGFLTFLESVNLMSVTVWPSVSQFELETFIGALRELPPGHAERGFWDDLAREKGLSGLAFNRLQYGSGVVESLLASPRGGRHTDRSEITNQIQVEALLDGSRGALRDALPRVGAELVALGDLTMLWQLLRYQFEGFEALESSERKKTISASRALLAGLVVTHQHQVAELGSDHLLAVLAVEDEPTVLAELAIALHMMASAALQFSDYQLAERILLAVRSRQRALERAPGEIIVAWAETFERELAPAAAQLLADDLQSGDLPRQEKAAGVLRNIGSSAAPILVEVIKQARDYRARRMAAGILAQMGAVAARQIKRDIVLEVTAEQRFRLLEIVDTVTQDLTDEIALCLGDGNAKVRRAAFRLADRLRDERLLGVLRDCAGNRDLNLAKGAVRCLARLQCDAAAAALASVLKTAKHPEIAAACCRGLGQLEGPIAVESLGWVLRARKRLTFRRRWDSQVRATAGLALLQIGNQKAAETLLRFAKDRDPRVRGIVSSASGGGPPPQLDDLGDE